MNLTQTEFLLSVPTQDFLATLFRQSKITGSVQINFVAAKLDISPSEAAQTIRKLQEMGMIQYEQYGKITLTESGKQYSRHLI